MDFLLPVGRISVTRSSYLHSPFPWSPLLSSDPPPSCSPSSSFRSSCSGRSSLQPSDGRDNGDDKKDEKSSMDWDKAWSSFRKQGKKRLIEVFPGQVRELEPETLKLPALQRGRSHQESGKIKPYAIDQPQVHARWRNSDSDIPLGLHTACAGEVIELVKT